MKKDKLRLKKHLRVRKKINGIKECPRLAVFRSNQHIYGQIIDDQAGRTLVSATDLKIQKKTKSDRAFEVGRVLAERAIEKGVKKVIFDRGGFIYHGRVKRLAEGAREGGLEF